MNRPIIQITDPGVKRIRHDQIAVGGLLENGMLKMRPRDRNTAHDGIGPVQTGGFLCQIRTQFGPG